MRVLVTGGADYIGSHTCVKLLNAGHQIFVIDNLCNGNETAPDSVQNITNRELRLINADVRDTNALDKIFNSFKFETVIHLLPRHLMCFGIALVFFEMITIKLMELVHLTIYILLIRR